jgi:hypothetical protein
VIVRLLPERDPDSTVRFSLDLLEGTLQMGLDGGEETKALAEDFAREQWGLLARRRQLVRAWGLLKLRRREDYGLGKRYCFQDFQAHRDHFAIPFVDHGRTWEAVDQYCVNPECACTDALIQFFAPWKDCEVLRPEFVALLDLKTGSAADPDGRPLEPEETRILEAFQGSLGDWCGELCLRKGLIRRIAAKRLRFPAPGEPAVAPGEFPPAMAREIPRATISPPPVLRETPSPARTPAAMTSSPATPPQPLRRDPARPGRNEPCPCGSGKKFKRCCGR